MENEWAHAQRTDTFFLSISGFLWFFLAIGSHMFSNRANVNKKKHCMSSMYLFVYFSAFVHRLYLPANKNYVRTPCYCVDTYTAHYNNNNGNKIIFIVTAIFMYVKRHSFLVVSIRYTFNFQLNEYHSSMFKANAFRFYGSESN